MILGFIYESKLIIFIFIHLARVLIDMEVA